MHLDSHVRIHRPVKSAFLTKSNTTKTSLMVDRLGTIILYYIDQTLLIFALSYISIIHYVKYLSWLLFVLIVVKSVFNHSEQ